MDSQFIVKLARNRLDYFISDSNSSAMWLSHPAHNPPPRLYTDTRIKSYDGLVWKKS